MKRILSLLCFMAVGYFAQAQCDVFISVDSSFVGITLTAQANTPGVTYQWDTGETTAQINANPAQTTYCVTALFPDGCVATTCLDLAGTGGGGNDCSVGIGIIQGGSWLQAIPVGTPPFTYSWNNGMTDMAIPISPNDSLLCVTMVDAEGCSSSTCLDVNTGGGGNDCFVSISEEITPIGVSVLSAQTPPNAAYIFQWSTGELTSDIFPNSPGTYCVTITNSDGSCTDTDCYDFTLDCSVVILDTLILPGDPQIALTAFANGTAPFSYQWNTGEIDQTIEIDSSGTYCATITDATGCVSEGCFDYIFEACSAVIEQSGSTTTSIDFCAVAQGEAPFTYLWSTGETSECINTNVDGTYSVTVTDAAGCVSEVCCISIVFIPPTNQLRGMVYPADSLNIAGTYEGFAYRIGLNPDGTASLIDSTALQSSPNGVWYDFGDVADGDYLVKVALTEGSDGYDVNMPTYHLSHLTWSEANPITIPAPSFSNFNIFMIYGDNPGGPGGIYGDVITGDGHGRPTIGIASHGGTEFTGDPLANVSILLFDESENPVAYAFTNGAGEFGFPSLAWGTYKVQIEIEGMNEAHYWVTIGPDNPEINDLIFEVTEEGISTDIHEIIAVETFQVFPNPTAENINIWFDSNNNAAIQISLTSLTGQVLKTDYQTITTGQQVIEMDLSTVSSGIYFLNMANGNEVISKKIVKK